ncbi:MAG TPA: histidine phosphatase family protein [Dehalococcoidia bacterium]|nr:histidine phosphatase family protein [Dehalococcoidia bacterium]
MTDSFSTRLILIRHGQTEYNLKGLSQGLIDIPLNETGERQADGLVSFLSPFRVSKIYSSPSSRAISTAEPLSKALSLEIAIESDLAEMDQGDYDGFTAEDMRKKIPQEFLDAWRSDKPDDVRMPNGETLNDVRERMVSICDSLAIRHRDSTVAIFSHNLSIKAFLCYGLGVALKNFRRLSISNGSVSIIDISPGERYLVNSINDIPELEIE